MSINAYRQQHLAPHQARNDDGPNSQAPIDLGCGDTRASYSFAARGLVVVVVVMVMVMVVVVVDDRGCAFVYDAVVVTTLVL